MLSTDLHNIAELLSLRAQLGEPMPPDRVQAMAVAISAAALMAEALEQTKIADEVHRDIARIRDEEREGERG